MAINHTPVRLTVGPRQQQMTIIGEETLEQRWFLENCENCKSITHYAGTERPPVWSAGRAGWTKWKQTARDNPSTVIYRAVIPRCLQLRCGAGILEAMEPVLVNPIVRDYTHNRNKCLLILGLIHYFTLKNTFQYTIRKHVHFNLPCVTTRRSRFH